MDILFLNPVFKQMIWGGDRLGREWNYHIPGNNTGECWAISAHPNGDCTIKNGCYKGSTLSNLWATHKELFGKEKTDRFPLLTKIIDAKSSLSVQVHPDDAYAKIHENGSLGKTECWYILDAQEGATLVIGHNAKDKAELEDMIYNHRWKEFIREIPVKKGDFIQIDPGTVHAINGGLMILETQENSDITYRIYDYDRLSNGKPRELHVKKSLDVITVPSKSTEKIVTSPDIVIDEPLKLMENSYYKIWRIDVDGDMEWDISQESFMIASVVDGHGKINDVQINKGDNFILSSDYKTIELSGRMELIISTTNEKD